MRQEFVVSADKNSGYPSFSDAVDIIAESCNGTGIFIGTADYLQFKNVHFIDNIIYNNTAFRVKNDYPVAMTFDFSLGLGAFFDNESLSKVLIPDSVKSIGGKSFFRTALKSVEIAGDCQYGETSFPPDCVIIKR